MRGAWYAWYVWYPKYVRGRAWYAWYAKYARTQGFDMCGMNDRRIWRLPPGLWYAWYAKYEGVGGRAFLSIECIVTENGGFHQGLIWFVSMIELGVVPQSLVCLVCVVCKARGDPQELCMCDKSRRWPTELDMPGMRGMQCMRGPPGVVYV